VRCQHTNITFAAASQTHIVETQVDASGLFVASCRNASRRRTTVSALRFTSFYGNELKWRLKMFVTKIAACSTRASDHPAGPARAA